MKKTLLLLLTVFTITAFAQEKPLISDAVLSVDRRNDLAEAKRFIDEAGKVIDQKAGAVDAKQMSKYLYYKGLIYYRISLSQDPAIAGLSENALEVASEYFIKLLEYEKQIGVSRYTNDALGQIPFVTQAIAMRAHDENAMKNYKAAGEDFVRVYELKKNPALGVGASFDTTSYYYGGYMFTMAEEYDKAVAILKDVLSMGYNGFSFSATNAASGEKEAYATKSMMDKKVSMGVAIDPEIGPSVRVDVYKALLQIYLAQKDTENFNALLAEARKELPSNLDLINMQLQGYLNAEEFDKAFEILNTAIEQDPTNPIYYYVQGYIYENNMKDGDKAFVAYGRSLELDSTNYECWFNSGKIWYDRGKAIIEQMNELGMSKADQKKYDVLKGDKEKRFATSIPFFEKAHKVNMEETEPVRALWEAYRQTGKYEKATEMKNLLEQMEGKEETAE